MCSGAWSAVGHRPARPGGLFLYLIFGSYSSHALSGGVAARWVRRAPLASCEEDRAGEHACKQAGSGKVKNREWDGPGLNPRHAAPPSPPYLACRGQLLLCRLVTQLGQAKRMGQKFLGNNSSCLGPFLGWQQLCKGRYKDNISEIGITCMLLQVAGKL